MRHQTDIPVSVPFMQIDTICPPCLMQDNRQSFKQIVFVAFAQSFVQIYWCIHLNNHDEKGTELINASRVLRLCTLL